MQATSAAVSLPCSTPQLNGTRSKLCSAFPAAAQHVAEGANFLPGGNGGKDVFLRGGTVLLGVSDLWCTAGKPELQQLILRTWATPFGLEKGADMFLKPSTVLKIQHAASTIAMDARRRASEPTMVRKRAQRSRHSPAPTSMVAERANTTKGMRIGRVMAIARVMTTASPGIVMEGSLNAVQLAIIPI
jgi:hypothetical protein